MDLFGEPDLEDIRRSAKISDDGAHRYVLGRRWTEGSNIATWIMLNPSTADAEIDDPTIRRCIAFTRAWGCDGLHVLNLFAFRSPYPAALDAADDPVGPLNDDLLTRHIWAARQQGRILVAAWGANERARERARHLTRVVGRPPWRCLGVTAGGHPRHPLFVRAAQPLIEWPGYGPPPRRGAAR